MSTERYRLYYGTIAYALKQIIGIQNDHDFAMVDERSYRAWLSFDDFRNENVYLHNELVKQNKILCEEIISLREQNLSLLKELANHHQILGNAINFYNGQRLSNYLVRLAGMQTADFIVNNMNKVKSFDDKGNYMRYVLNHIKSALGGGIGIWRLQWRNDKFYFGNFA